MSEHITRLDWLALVTLAGVTGWVVIWRSVIRAIDRVEYRIDEIAGEE